MPSARSSSTRFLPHAVVATFVVMVLPALAASAIETSGRPWLMLLSLPMAMILSLAAASLGSAIWMRWPGSRDLVFGDLMLWGWLRRVRAERRLAEARELVGAGTSGVGGQELGPDRRCELLQQLGVLLEARDTYTHGHTRRVTRHSERIAREMGLSHEEVAKVRTAAAVHDVGKIHTPREVLTKPGRLTDDEFAVIKRHPVDGAEMVVELGDPEITAMVRHHHERLDGTGYPDGLVGDQIPLGARIVSVADTFDAMTSSRPYRGASRHKKALDVLSKEADSQLDPIAVAAFLRYYSGKRSVAWSAFVVAAPQRLGSWFGGLFQGMGAGAAPLAPGILAMGAAALVGSSLGGAAAPATAVVESAAHHEARPDGEKASTDGTPNETDRKGSSGPRHGSKLEPKTRGGAEERARTRETGAPTRPHAPNTGGNDQQLPQSAPEGGSQGGSAPEDESGPNATTPADGSPAPLPDVQVPEVQVPEVQVPEVQLPEVQLPEVPTLP